MWVGVIGSMENSSSYVGGCYNIGEVSGTAATSSYLGGVIGGAYKGTYEYCFNLQDTALDVYGYTYSSGGGTFTNCEILSSSEMKEDSFISLLNSVSSEEIYVKDTKNLNSGYPILSWQCE